MIAPPKRGTIIVLKISFPNYLKNAIWRFLRFNSNRYIIFELIRNVQFFRINFLKVLSLIPGFFSSPDPVLKSVLS